LHELSGFDGSNPQRRQQGSGRQELDEVIVTARKREESILEVPVVETAIRRFWQVAFIANNITNKITNKITTGACTLLAYNVGQVLPGSVTGGPTTGPAGTAENTCVARPGRELWVRVTLRPLAWSE
jgi:hypothetical protein